MSVGELKVSGINVKDYKIKILRESIVIFLQKNFLFIRIIESNLKFGNEHVALSEKTEACEVAYALEFIQEKEGKFKAKDEQGGTNFSDGQKQRLSIARIILKKT